MRLNSPQRAYTYKSASPSFDLADDLLAGFKSHIKQSPAITSNDDVLKLFLNTAIAEGEKYTRKEFTEKSFQTFRDTFPNPLHQGYYPYGTMPGGQQSPGFEIRKSPLISISEVSYFNTSGTESIVDDTTYYNTIEEDYSELLINDGESWPDDCAGKMDGIKISFTAGMASDSSVFLENYPDLVLAIYEHAAFLNANRGDCSKIGISIPVSSKSIYLKYRIENL